MLNYFRGFFSLRTFFGGSGQHFRQQTDVAAAPLAAGPAAAATAATAVTATGASSCRLRLPTGDWHLPGSRPVRQILGKLPPNKYITANTRLTVQVCTMYIGKANFEEYNLTRCPAFLAAKLCRQFLCFCSPLIILQRNKEKCFDLTG
jgi:hypothetical protein